MNRKARRAVSRQERRRESGARDTSGAALQLMSQALRHQQAGRWADATACYQRALALEPAHARAHNALGSLLTAQGRIHEALAAFEKAIELDPALVTAHVSLGNLHRGNGDNDRAIESYLRAIEIQPDEMNAHNNLCALMLAQGKYNAVSDHLAEVLAVKPDYLPGYHTLAAAHLGAGRPAQALEVLMGVLARAETVESRALFVLAVQNLNTIPTIGGLPAMLVRAMSEPWGRPGDLTRQCIRIINSSAEMSAGIARAVRAWPERLPARELFGATGPGTIFQDALLRCLLENARADDVGLERFLTSARLSLLQTAAASSPKDEIGADAMAFSCALARQCFINDYVYADTEDERAKFEALQQALEGALAANAPVAGLWLVATAAYVPLGQIARSGELLARSWPPPIEALLTQQLREPEKERSLRAEIPRLTAIDDDISIAVREQYEENPYPRWVKAAPASRPVTIDARLRNQFPRANFRNLGKTSDVDVLVAGCGTGQQLVDVAQRIVGAHVLAIDLSLASLAYAKRQTDALGLRHIEYGQADILRLGQIGRRFDAVDCGGVLHHLRDPQEGWRVLLSLLRPHGLMRVALYSELARPHIVAAREFIAANGYRREPADIRKFRQDVLAMPDGDLVKTIAQSPDFFSISDCRDLVFHAQEHRFTLPQIREFCAANRLEFLGFEIDFRVLDRYAAQNPDDPARTDLTRWNTYEKAHPMTFGGMYQFWVQKRD